MLRAELKEGMQLWCPLPFFIKDYVGSCINMAARIQKLPGITFCFNRRGFELEAATAGMFFTKGVVVKQVSIRGIGEHELVCVLRKEADALTPKDRKLYKDPTEATLLT
jgi:hypothetical protein